MEEKLYAKFSKCEFWLTLVEFLGHVVSSDWIKVYPKKIEAFHNWPRPSSATKIWSFLSLAEYYRRFMEDFMSIAAPLTRLTQKGSSFTWSDECEERFQKLKTDTVQHDNAKEFSIGDDGVLRMQGWICMPNVDGLHEMILE
ncbi:uncharacterized mitochondrial protein AtMg00860-like [Nicotiana tomentosiformis]|uniref:uncharacterized mitochondrial protein AtMg00860-like n=1 Tax=Nicotiana tomentosiformis TaxID=4098 RepID=UPI00388C8C6B